MNTTLFLSELRDLLDDANGVKYPDDMLIRAANRQMRGLFRTMTEANKEYSNYTVGWPASGNATQVASTMWEFRMPSWITHVVDVYVASGFTVPENFFESYKWTNGQNVVMGQVIPKHTTNSQFPHWTWEGNNNTIRLWNYTTCPDIVVRVTVRPAALFKGTIATAAASPSEVYLPPNLTYGTIEPETGSLLNGVIEVTRTQNVNSTNYGAVRRIVYSSSNTVVSGSRTNILTLDKRYDTVLAVGDVVESIIPIPDEHTRLLVLKTAQAAFQRKANMEGLRAISAEMSEEFTKFVNYATPPRDSNGPTFIKRNLRNRAPWNNEYPYFWGWSW